MEALNHIQEVKVNQTKEVLPHKARILVIEDDITCEPIWNYIIERADGNAHFDWATSISEAESKIEKALFEGKGYDLLISDIFVSGSKTGIDLWNHYAHLMAGKIILVSGIDYLKMTHYIGNKAGTPLYLKKPLIIHECIEAVYGLLRQPRI